MITNDIFSFDAQRAVVVGDSGRIYLTTDGGATWIRQAAGTVTRLRSVFFANQAMGWVVGDFGTILRTVDGGHTWEAQSSGTLEDLRSLFFVDVAHGWAVGANGVMLRTADGGSNWELKKSPTFEWWNSVRFLNLSTGFVAGEAGSNNFGKTRDGGQTWQMSQINRPQEIYRLNSVWFIDENTGWVAGLTGPSSNFTAAVVKTTDGGATWNRIYYGGISSINYRIQFVNRDTGWVLHAGGLSYPGQQYSIDRTIDGGAIWQPQLAIPGTLTAFHFPSERIGWVCDLGGRVWRTTDAGATWNQSRILTSIARGGLPLPTSFVLEQNYPNPFNPTTVIRYSLPITSHVVLKLYNILAEEIATLVEEEKHPGSYEASWDATKFASGIYFCRLKAGSFVGTKKLLLLR